MPAVNSLQLQHIFSLGGGNHTGIGFHSHDENWLAQLFGRKAWFVLPVSATVADRCHLLHCHPILVSASIRKGRWRCQRFGVGIGQAGGRSGMALHPCDMLDAKWSDSAHGSKDVRRCVVLPGQTVYVPANWLHQPWAVP